jgi:hypothetical protein
MDIHLNNRAIVDGGSFVLAATSSALFRLVAARFRHRWRCGITCYRRNMIPYVGCFFDINSQPRLA